MFATKSLGADKPESAALSDTSQELVCSASADWLSQPYSPPTEIPNNGANFCDFYQFSWQWFVHLMAPLPVDKSTRVFEDKQNYPIVQADGSDSCENEAAQPAYFIRSVKASDNSTTPQLPERIGQAGGGDTIYDQNGNVVFYSIRFNKELCQAKTNGNLPAGTTELKLAWRVISEEEKADYVWVQADVIPAPDGTPVIPELLGLIGFHLVNSTPEHPEFVWASYEHKNNAPNCIDAGPQVGWSFTSDACVACLQSPSETCLNKCRFNSPKPATSISDATPSEICRVYQNGTAVNDDKATENLAVIATLNEQLVGENGIITKLPDDNRLAVLKNYLNIGALWESDVTLPSSKAMNQRGSLQLANPVMETSFQGSLQINAGKFVNDPDGDAVNCFACHGYTPGKTAEGPSISHIFDSIHGQP